MNAQEALPEDPEFLADGGMLGFGLRHSYPMKDDIKHAYDLLRESDVVVYRSAREIRFESVLYVYNEWQPPWFKSKTIEGALIDGPIDFEF